jgi:hypothetical protein
LGEDIPPGRLDSASLTRGYVPADAIQERDWESEIELREADLGVVSECVSGSHTWVVLWHHFFEEAYPDQSHLLAVHVVRDDASRTFRYATCEIPILALAQQWLVGRGCPPGALKRNRHYSAEADASSQSIETRLTRSPHRYALADHGTVYDPDPPGSWAIIRDKAPASSATQWQVLVESAGAEQGTYVLRERSFPTRKQAEHFVEQLPTVQWPLAADPPRTVAVAPPLNPRPGRPRR